MSIIDASTEDAPSKPKVTPMQLALDAQRNINVHHISIGVQGNLIRQLLVGRHVRHKTTDGIWLVKEVRIGLGGGAILYGRTRGSARNRAIGPLVDVDIHYPAPMERAL